MQPGIDDQRIFVDDQVRRQQQQMDDDQREVRLQDIDRSRKTRYAIGFIEVHQRDPGDIHIQPKLQVGMLQNIPQPSKSQ